MLVDAINKIETVYVYEAGKSWEQDTMYKEYW